MVPALVIWFMLILVAQANQGLRFIKLTWVVHIAFNVVALILWMPLEAFYPYAYPDTLMPLAVILPVLATSAFFFRKTRNFILE
jgi:hypothetical protein